MSQGLLNFSKKCAYIFSLTVSLEKRDLNEYMNKTNYRISSLSVPWAPRGQNRALTIMMFEQELTE